MHKQYWRCTIQEASNIHEICGAAQRKECFNLITCKTNRFFRKANVNLMNCFRRLFRFVRSLWTLSAVVRLIGSGAHWPANYLISTNCVFACCFFSCVSFVWAPFVSIQSVFAIGSKLNEIHSVWCSQRNKDRSTVISVASFDLLLMHLKWFFLPANGQIQSEYQIRTRPNCWTSHPSSIAERNTILLFSAMFCGRSKANSCQSMFSLFSYSFNGCFDTSVEFHARKLNDPFIEKL